VSEQVKKAEETGYFWSRAPAIRYKPRHKWRYCVNATDAAMQYIAHTLCSVQAHRLGEALQRAAIRRRFLSACKILELARLRTLTNHHGGHTVISHALAGERTLAEMPITSFAVNTGAVAMPF
jgi:hypothetical protein